MIPLTPLLAEYKNSYFLYAFRHLDRMRSVKSKHLADILASESTYLYDIASLISYREVQRTEVNRLTQWAKSADAALNLEQFKLLFEEKIVELNLRAFQPRDYSYTFKTIWDVIHFLALIIDDMTLNRQKDISHESMLNNLQAFKTIYYNLFFKLDCAMCRDHYLNVKGYLIMSVERIEIAFNRERAGEAVVWTDESPSSNDSLAENRLMRYGILYATMAFHNHINDYRWVQRNVKPPSNHERMTWTKLRKALALT
uniref:Protein p33 n=1 Tax=Lymantria dispar multicapsid nuclear polyhedrosis virus TaxID=10449 RepID=A0A1B1MQV8_NPVLD|nr:protein p33 [Lymantria dispar multiple nucleopolyhedrovirus]